MEGGKFRAVCSECGRECEIPFEPKEGRPVKCDECFRKGRRQFRKPRFKKEFRVKCAECGKETTVPFKPVQGKPVLCRECFNKSKN